MALCVVPPSSAHAESTRFMDLDGFARLLDGEFEGTTLNEDGSLSLGQATREVELAQDAALGASALWRDELVAARLSQPGGIIRIDNRGTLTQIVAAQEGVITKLFADGDNLLIAGGPNATLQKLDSKKRVVKMPAPDAKFIWDIARGPDGALYAVSGEPGALWRQSRDGTWKCLYTSREAHLKVLTYAPALAALLIGGGEKGIVYSVNKAGEVHALFDTQNREVTALAVAGKQIVVAAVTGAQAAVVDEGQAAKVEVKSQLFRLDAEGAAEGLAASNDEILFDVVAAGPQEVLVATGATARTGGVSRGRLYRIQLAKRQVTLVYQSPSRRLVALHRGPRGRTLAVSQEGPRIIELLGDMRRRGTYTSPTADLGVSSTLGVAQVFGAFPAHCDAQLEVRSGHTAEPDATWSPWSEPIAHHNPQPPKVRRGRFAQLRLTLSGSGVDRPQIYRQRLAYLRQNVAPAVREVNAMERGTAIAPLPPSFAGEDGPVRIAPLFEKTDDGAPSGAAAARSVPRVRLSHEPGALSVRWLADDANGDELEYTLWMRQTHEPRWTLVREHLSDPFYTFSSGQLADGHYLFRVEATDVRSNPIERALGDGQDSRIIVVDNKPPVISNLRVRVSAQDVVLSATVHDDVGPLVVLSYSLDGAQLRPLSPLDGVLDGPDEQVRTSLGRIAPGAHVVTLHAQDAAGNEATSAESFIVSTRAP